MIDTHEGLHPTAATAAFLSPEDLTADPAAELAAKNAEILDLKTRLDAQILKGNNRDVELANGETLTVKKATMRLEDMSVETQLEVLKGERYVAEMNAHAWALANAVTPLAAQVPLLTKDSAIKLMGLDAWTALPNATKALVLDTRQSDVAAYKPEDIFGPTSSSRAAHELAKENIAVYKLLKLQAIKKGLIG